MPPRREVVPAKQSATTCSPSPIASKIWAPMYDATVETPILLITLRTPLASASTATRNGVQAPAQGVRKVMSKMGVSTVASYIGAQIFEAIGLGEQVVADCFAGTTSRLGGVGYDVLAEEVAIRHRLAWPADGVRANHRELAVGGEYQWRREGELHVFNPHTVFKLQHAARTQNYDTFKEYTRAVDEQSSALLTLRGLFAFKHDREAVRMEEVEPVSEIVKRFNTGAISYGSISQEMH